MCVRYGPLATGQKWLFTPYCLYSPLAKAVHSWINFTFCPRYTRSYRPFNIYWNPLWRPIISNTDSTNYCQSHSIGISLNDYLIGFTEDATVGCISFKINSWTFIAVKCVWLMNMSANRCKRRSHKRFVQRFPMQWTRRCYVTTSSNERAWLLSEAHHMKSVKT